MLSQNYLYILDSPQNTSSIINSSTCMKLNYSRTHRNLTYFHTALYSLSFHTSSSLCAEVVFLSPRKVTKKIVSEFILSERYKLTRQ